MNGPYQTDKLCIDSPSPRVLTIMMEDNMAILRDGNGDQIRVHRRNLRWISRYILEIAETWGDVRT